MSKAAYWQRGETLDYKNNTDTKIEANTVISFGSHIGVAGKDIHPRELGSLVVTGVFEIDKTATGAIEMGTEVYFDGTGITDVVGEGSIKAGYAAAPADAAGASVLVSING